MARIIDVARLAGVSTATVSRVVNGMPVRPDLAEKVRQAVDELGYTPDRTARTLRRGRSDVIALVLPDIENPFFTSVARGVEDVASRSDLSVVLCNTDDDPAKEQRYLQIARDENMLGVVLAPATSEPQLDAFLAQGRPVVVLDRRVAAPVDQVTFDNLELGRMATQALIDAGCRRIACVTGPVETTTAVDRATGWRQALEAAGIEVDTDLLRHADFRVEGGFRAATELLRLDPLPDALLATNNLVGVGALRALAGLTRRPHPKVGMIGDLPFSTGTPPDLTLVPLHPRRMGTRAAEMLLERTAGLVEPPRTVVLAAHGPLSM